MRYASICSGIESATVAWEPLGWEPVWFAEIEKFPSSVLNHHWPEVPNRGDFTKITDSEPIDLLVGGTPCQSFSTAGQRAGLDDPRGNLTLEWLRLVERILPRWLVWENVPGVLSIDDGRTFGAVLGALAKLGYGFAYRVLDAQYFGVAQRRRRVFVVGCLGDWRSAAAVLFEPESLRRDSPPSREAGTPAAALTANGVGTCGADDNQAQAGNLVAFDPNQVTSPHNRSNPKPGLCHTIPAQSVPPMIARTLRSEGFDASEDGTGRGTPLVPVLNARQDPLTLNDQCGPLDTDGHTWACGVRRLTPLECERLQGFPDGHTAIPGAKDSPRYKAIGNAMAVPVMRWIGERIAIRRCE